jgi:hypothetical protein
MSDVDEGNDLSVIHGPVVGKLLKPDRNSGLEAKAVQDYIIQTCEETFKFMEELNQKMRDITENGKAMDQSTGAWSPAIAKEIYRLLNKANKGAGFSTEDLKLLVNNKYHLYKKIYLAKKVKGAKYPALSYVMFMPEEDFHAYIRTLGRLDRAYDDSEDKKREALFNTFKDLLSQFTGNESISKKDVGGTSLEELSAIMQGVEGEGLVLGGTLKSIKIGDIMSKKKMPLPELDDLIKSILTKLDKLEEIKSLGSRYEFSYSTDDNTYYWIPIDYAL